MAPRPQRFSPTVTVVDMNDLTSSEKQKLNMVYWFTDEPGWRPFPYVADPRCAKCDSPDPAMEYQEYRALTTPDGETTRWIESTLRCDCKRCGWMWLMWSKEATEDMRKLSGITQPKSTKMIAK